MTQKRIAFLLVSGAAMLLLELRLEHHEVLAETWRSWIPLVYAGAIVLAGAVALLRWEGFGRRMLAVLFGLGIAVGALGFFFHSEGKPLRSVQRVLGAWTGAKASRSEPPPLAPLAFCGLGALGVLACAPRRD